MIWFKSQELVFPKEITINNFTYNIEVSFSKKKNSSAQVKEETLVFRLSSYLSKKQSNEHFHELLNNLVKKVEKSPKKKKLSFKEILERREFSFARDIYKLEHTNKVRGVKLKENTFFINPHTKEENIEKHILKLLIERYYDRLKEYLHTLNSQTYNYEITGFELKLINSKWGHCTHDNKILLNLKLLNATPEILNYVIYHEISHIKVKNHSDRFWKEVSRFCPNYKVLRKALKNNPPDEVFI